MTADRDLVEPHGRYDAMADAFYVRLAPDGVTIADTREVASSVMLDLDAAGDVVGIEVLAASSVFRTGDDPPWAAPSPDRLQEALGAYVARFGGKHSPFLFSLHGVEEMAVAIAMLRHAVAAGRPLGWWQIMAALGVEQPSDGVAI